jgi:hypothetical protein
VVWYDGFVWWFCMVVLDRGLCLGGSVRCAYMVVLYDGFAWWFCVVVLYGGLF